MGTLYTGTGDEGYTNTIDCGRILKSDDRIELLGTLDEAMACLGVAKAHNPELKALLEDLQKKLNQLMCELAGGVPAELDSWISETEALIDRYLPKDISEFVVPGKTLASAELDRSRTIVRRAERIAVRQKDKLRKEVLVYLNRLSDLVYALERFTDQ